MKVTYTGKQAELSPLHRKKLDARFVKLAKMLDGKEEREAHVFLTSERHLQNAEITVQYYDHALVGAGSSEDLLTALTSAIEKLEKQLVKQRTKWRDTKRTPKAKAAAVAGPGEEEAGAAETGPELAEVSGQQIFRLNHHESRKPMTLEEAVFEMDADRDYLVYRDAETDRISVLLRRRDGNLSLIEG
jgi:putative sigma-54 modulation protein